MTEKQLDKIREQFEKMDNEFWRDLSKELLEAVTYMGLGERITIDASIDKGEDLDVEYKA